MWLSSTWEQILAYGPRTELIKAPWRSGVGFPFVDFGICQVRKIDVFNQVDRPQLLAVKIIILTGHGQGVLEDGVDSICVHGRKFRGIGFGAAQAKAVPKAYFTVLVKQSFRISFAMVFVQ